MHARMHARNENTKKAGKKENMQDAATRNISMLKKHSMQNDLYEEKNSK
jgi:hypothetical protein